MSHLNTRRRARALGLRCLRVVRRHYFSVLSGGVLGAALILAVTSSSFSVKQPAIAQSGQPEPGLIQSTVAAGAIPPTGSAVSPRVLIYYLISAGEQRQEMEAAIWNHAAAVSIQPRVQTLRDFVLIPSEEAEREIFQHLRQAIAIGEYDGYRVQVVDLR